MSSTPLPWRQLGHGMRWPLSWHKRLADTSPQSLKIPEKQPSCFNVCARLFNGGMRSPSRIQWSPSEVPLQLQSLKIPEKQPSCFNVCAWLFNGGMRSPSRTPWSPIEVPLQPLYISFSDFHAYWLCAGGH